MNRKAAAARRSPLKSAAPSPLDYNASVIDLRLCHADLMVLRVSLDEGTPEFLAGQYTVLGLGSWEPRVAGVQEEEPHQPISLIKRAYSVCCPMVDEQGRLLPVQDLPYLEFYIVLVRQAAKAPALTPRLFTLRKGSRLYCNPRMHGRYTLPELDPHSKVVFLATGTGEAPNNAMVADLLARGHHGPIVSAVSVRQRQDLPYLPLHRHLERLYPNYHYVGLTTREPENLDATRPDFVGKRYLQDFVESGDLEAILGAQLDPRDTHIFLCGTPQMIGAPIRTNDPGARYPKPLGMVELLERRGFQIDLPHESGNIHFESYW